MKRILITLTAAALLIGAFGLAALQPVSAQQGSPPICLTLAPGEHTFTAPARDREGEVTFTVIVGEGGQVTEFIEPGGQSIPPAAMLQLFTGDEAYPLPDGVMIVECGEPAGDSMMEDAAPPVCVNLDPGTHTGTVSAGGRSYEITMHIGEGGRVNSVELLGQSYSAQEAIGLLEGFGATLPQGVQIVPCAAADSGAMETEDAQDDAQPTLYANTGTGGLADSSDNSGMWAAIATVSILFLTAATVARRRGVKVRIRD